MKLIRKLSILNFWEFKWTKNDAIDRFGEKFLTLRTSLEFYPTLIRTTFIRGLPHRLQAFAHAYHGSYDQLVTSGHQILILIKVIYNIRKV